MLLGTTVILAAKLAGTAIVARLFSLTKGTLMQLNWFARLYNRWTTWKEHLLAQVRASWPWRLGRVLRHRIKQRWQQQRRRWFQD